MDMVDRQRIEQFRAGDREAFDGLLDAYYGKVYGLCFRMTGNVSEAEELAHDAFVEAYLKLDQLREPEKFGGWLKTLVLNGCRQWYRSKKRAPEKLMEEYEITVEEETDDSSLLVKMGEGLSRLSAEQRLILVLRYYENLTYEEIARFCDIPAGTVMSRLNRAKGALKTVLTTIPDGEVPMMANERFKEEVRAEIEILLRVFPDEPKAGDRLAGILAGSPERLAFLLKSTADPSLPVHLAVLLPRLGASVFPMFIDLVLSGEETVKRSAGQVIEAFIGRCKPILSRWTGGIPEDANLNVYFLLDALIASPVRPEEKAALLARWLEVTKDASASVLLMNVLMGYPEPAFEQLIERFRAMAGPEELYQSSWVLYGLCRTGNRFVEMILSWLASREERERRLALTGAEALGRCLEWIYMRGTSQMEVLSNIRNRPKWPVLRRCDLGEENLNNLSQAVAGLLADSRPVVREGALRTLGRLKAQAQFPMILPYLDHPESATRLAAILALSQFDNPAGEEALHRIAAEGTSPERSAVKNAIDRIAMNRRAPWQYIPTEREAKIAAKIRGNKQPVTHVSLTSVLMFALTELREYDEREIHQRLAGCCWDHALVRRNLVEQGLMTREEGIYQFTDLGKAAWQVEQFILNRYLRPLLPLP